MRFGVSSRALLASAAGTKARQPNPVVANSPVSSNSKSNDDGNDIKKKQLAISPLSRATDSRERELRYGW